MAYVSGTSKEIVDFIDVLGIPKEGLFHFSLHCSANDLLTLECKYRVSKQTLENLSSMIEDKKYKVCKDED